jgi:hypothetical protein
VVFLSAEPVPFVILVPVRLAIRLSEKIMVDGRSFFNSARLPVAPAVLATGIFIADTVTRVDIAVAVLYVAVLLLSARFCRLSGVATVAAGCAALTARVTSICSEWSRKSLEPHLPDICVKPFWSPSA